MNRIIKTGVGKKSRRDDILLTVGKTYGQEITSLLKVPHGTTQIPYGRNDGKTSHVIDRTCPVRDKILVEKRETATTQRPVRDVTCQKTLLPTARFFAREKSVSTNMSSLTGLKPYFYLIQITKQPQ